MQALDAQRAGGPAKAVEIAQQAVALAGELGLAKPQADVRRTLARFRPDALRGG